MTTATRTTIESRSISVAIGAWIYRAANIRARYVYVILEERRFLRPEGYVFGNESGQRVTAFGRAWRALFNATGLPADLVWHDTRHEFVSSLIDEGGNIQEVKEAARHKSMLTTARYMKVHEERVKALLRRAERGGKNPI